MADRMIFLSHRFADKRIADVVRRHLGLWGFDTQCYQASAPGLGPKAGEFITLDIKEALYEAKLVILIYILTDYDWSFCMWECGLATHPTKTDTRTIVLQCNPNDTPRIFANQLLIEASEEGIHNFTIQFFREEGFFPGRPALRPDITDAVVADYSHAFYAELIASIPPGQHEERYRWDYIILHYRSLMQT